MPAEHIVEVTILTDRSVADTARTAADMARLLDMDDAGTIVAVNVLTYEDDGGWDQEHVQPVDVSPGTGMP